MVVDESISYWREKDQLHGSEGCGHVTKIPHKPKSVGMGIKNICCCDNNIMVHANHDPLKTRCGHVNTLVYMAVGHVCC